MRTTRALSLAVTSSILGLAPCSAQQSVTLPQPDREFRAAWVATVANIDWPSKPGLPVKTQQREAIAILDQLVALNMNAVVFQVRPHADALYRSELEPWSYYLTGKQGQAPSPAYDPLEFWVREAHARGLQLHAWFNPYRANHPAQRGAFAADSIVRQKPELVVQLGSDGYWWMDPALPAVQDHSIAVVLDVVKRYDVDGVHFDDYFYPYESYNDGKDFPDDASFAVYRAGGGELSRKDWRRHAVDTFIERLYREIKQLEPRVEFGISPFGIWRPGHPPSIAGLDQYDSLYADAKRWLNEGWVDYFTPQLYWPIAQIPQSFPVLLGWWHRENVQSRHLWPGTSIGRRSGEAGTTELLNQIMITRGMQLEGPGMCFFSMKSLMREDSELTTALLAGPYAKPALIPPSPWLDAEPPPAPQLDIRRTQKGIELKWQQPKGSEDVLAAVIWIERRASWSIEIVPSSRSSLTIDDATGVTRIAIAAADRVRNLGSAAMHDVGKR